MTSPHVPDPKTEAILTAAFTAFCQYGFRRTSMEDIARGAGMSRAALYLHYKNKEDILRSLTSFYFEQAIGCIMGELVPARDPVDLLLALFQQAGGPAIAQIIASPHGAELVEVKQSACSDLVQQGSDRMDLAVSRWLEAEATAGRVTLAASGGDALAMARLIHQMWDALKLNSTDAAAFETGTVQLAHLIGRGLRA